MKRKVSFWTFRRQFSETEIQTMGRNLVLSKDEAKKRNSKKKKKEDDFWN